MQLPDQTKPDWVHRLLAIPPAKRADEAATLLGAMVAEFIKERKPLIEREAGLADNTLAAKLTTYAKKPTAYYQAIGYLVDYLIHHGTKPLTPEQRTSYLKGACDRASYPQGLPDRVFERDLPPGNLKLVHKKLTEAGYLPGEEGTLNAIVRLIQKGKPDLTETGCDTAVGRVEFYPGRKYSIGDNKPRTWGYRSGLPYARVTVGDKKVDKSLFTLLEGLGVARVDVERYIRAVGDAVGEVGT